MFYDEQEGRVLHWIPLTEIFLPKYKISVDERNEFTRQAKRRLKKLPEAMTLP